MSEKKFNLKNYIGIGLIILSAAAFVLMLMQTLTEDIWYDEVFSVGFMERSIGEICALTARDVHPPFYYIYLKVMAGVLALIPGVSQITAAKLASLIPWVALLALGLTFVRKRFSLFTAGAFLFLITCMPQLGIYYLEIRMYSLALLLITGAFLISVSIMDSPKLYKWILLWILGALTAYTQYYACVAIVALYIVLGIYLIIEKRFKDFRMEALMALLSAIIYIPWLPSLYRQMTTISGNYWIQPLTIRSIFGCVKFVALPVVSYSLLPYISVGLVLLVTIAAAVIFIIKRQPVRSEIYVAFGGFGIIFFVILSGFILSAMGTPIFTYRYMIPCLGALYLGIAYILDKSSERVLILLFICPFILEGFLSIKGLYEEEHKKIVYTPQTMEALSQIPDNSVIITNFDHVTSIMSYYMKNDEIYLYEGSPDPLIPAMFMNCKGEILREDIPKTVASNPDVYFFGSFNSREDILKDWEELSVNYEEENSCLLERYWFNIYKLSCGE